VIVPNKNGKLRICVDFKMLDATIKKDLNLLPFINEVINIVIGHEVYIFLDEFSRYYQISIAPKDHHKIAFVTN
jgi:hypothetical protein